MFAAAALLSLIQAVALVSGAYTPLAARNIHARHAAIIHARSPAPAPAPAPALVPAIKKRDSKKCRARPSSSSIAPSPSVAPANPGSNPDKPQPTTQQAPKPTPKPQPTSTKHNDPKPTNDPPSGGDNNNGGGGGGGGGGGPFGNFHSGTRHGALTFYALGLTACGQSFSDGDMVAAVSHSLFDSVPGANGNPNNNPICGKRINVSFGGKTVNVAIQDRCEGCAPDDIDLSPTAFARIASQSLGRIQGTWQWA